MYTYYIYKEKLFIIKIRLKESEHFKRCIIYSRHLLDRHHVVHRQIAFHLLSSKHFKEFENN